MPTQPTDKELLTEFIKLTEQDNSQVKLDTLFEHDQNMLRLLKHQQFDESFLTNPYAIRLWKLIRQIYDKANTQTLFKDEYLMIDKMYEQLNQYFHGLTYEKVVVIALDSGSHPIDYLTVNIGTNNASITDHRRILRWALDCHADAIILTHNHPNGSLDPSTDDVEDAKSLYYALSQFDISLIDSLIITDTGHQSLGALDLLPNPFASTNDDTENEQKKS